MDESESLLHRTMRRASVGRKRHQKSFDVDQMIAGRSPLALTLNESANSLLLVLLQSVWVEKRV
jgi:hypothetical protein